MKKTAWIFTVMLALLMAGCDRISLAGIGSQATSTPVIALVQNQGGVIAEGNIEPSDSAWIYTRSGGQVSEILVKQGDDVKKDAVLLRFGDHGGIQAALAAAQAAQISAQQALDDLNKKAALAGSQAQAILVQSEKDLVDAKQALSDLDTTQYQDDLDTLQKDVGTAKSDLDDAQKDYDKVKDMDPSNNDRKTAQDKLKDTQKKYDDAVNKRDLKINDLDQANAAVTKAQAQRDEAQREYDDRKNGPDPDSLAVAQANLKNAQEQVKAAQIALDDLEVKAPFDGTVTSLTIAVGETLVPNMVLMQIANLGELYVDTNDLTEMEVVKIKNGQKASIVPDALPDLNLPVTVDRIDRVSGKKGGDVTYTVRLKLDQTDPRLLWGMTVEVRFSE